MSELRQAVIGAESCDAPTSVGQECQGAPANGDKELAILLPLAQPRGDTDPWNIKGVALSAGPPRLGGIYTETAAVARLNVHYCVGVTENDIAIYRIGTDGLLTFTRPEDFKLHVANMHVEFSAGGVVRRKAAATVWMQSQLRHEKRIVFKPGGTAEPGEYNQWRGFAVDPHKGWQKQRRLLQHIREVICRRDRAKLKYLLRWLAWAVQNPEKHAGVVIILKSRKQGTGKSTLGKVMLDIFGQHGALIDDKDRLLGRFTDWLETVSFVLAEEIMFAGDHKANDKFKSVVTSDTIQVERKFGSCWQITNRLKIIATTNHDHAVAAGVQDRRNVVYDVSDERVGNKAWFDDLYRDLANGGISEFLYFLKNVQLGDWHPRQVLKTTETTEQQRMSADTVSQWSQACIDADAVIGDPHRAVSHDLGQRVSSQELRDAYAGYCRQYGLRAANRRCLGRRVRRCSAHVRALHFPTPSVGRGPMTYPTATSGRRS